MASAAMAMESIIRSKFDELSKWLIDHHYNENDAISIAVHELCDSVEDLQNLTAEDFDNVTSVKVKVAL